MRLTSPIRKHQQGPHFCFAFQYIVTICICDPSVVCGVALPQLMQLTQSEVRGGKHYKITVIASPGEYSKQHNLTKIPLTELL